MSRAQCNGELLKPERGRDRRADDQHSHGNEPTEDNRDAKSEAKGPEVLVARQTRPQKEVVGHHCRPHQSQGQKP